VISESDKYLYASNSNILTMQPMKDPLIAARVVVSVSVPVKTELNRIKEEGSHTSLDSVIRTLISEHKLLAKRE